MDSYAVERLINKAREKARNDHTDVVLDITYAEPRKVEGLYLTLSPDGSDHAQVSHTSDTLEWSQGLVDVDMIGSIIFGDPEDV